MKYPGKFQGLNCLADDHQSARLISDMERRKGEIIELLKHGNNIFVILPSEQSIYVRTGKKEYSGTGKNMQTTNIVDIYNLLSFLPIEIKVIKAKGTKISFENNRKTDLLKNIKNNFQYHSYIEECEGLPLMYIANTSKAVGMHVEYEKGNIIFLPSFAEDELYKNNNDWQQAINRSIYTIMQLDNELRMGFEQYILPEWSKNVLVPNEKDAIELLDSYEKELQEIKSRIKQQKVKIEELQKVKIVLTATGEVLENICKEMLLKLGFKALPTENNRSDLVLKYGRKDIVIEVKGLSKSAGEKNAAQLEKWVSEHIENYERHPKAILLVNAYREIPINERTEDVFPKQMLKYAIGREQCLLSTTQFICLYLDCLSNSDKKNDKIKKMLNTVGIYNEYESITEYLTLEN